MKSPLKYTANYSNCNHNFSIQGIRKDLVSSEFSAGIAILKNILQRGAPTLMSTFLQEHLGQIHEFENFSKPKALVSKEVPQWKRIIRGDVKNNYFPAEKFFFELIPKYFGEYQFVQQLIAPEVPINFITQVEVNEFKEQQVDFYLPQALLVIEIDGSQHKISREDIKRDSHLKKYGIETYRITTEDINKETDHLIDQISKIIERIQKVEQRISKLDNSKKEGVLLTTKDYQTAYYSDQDLSDPEFLSTAIIRFQILLLELIDRGILNLNSTSWDFEVLNHDVEGYTELAIKDLFIWFKHLFQLQQVKFNPPKFKVQAIENKEDFSIDSSIVKIDFSLLERYTDEFQENQQDIYTVRGDYFDYFMFFKKGSAEEIQFSQFKRHDYFTLSTSNLINYKLRFGKESKDQESLRFLLWNIFLQTDKTLSYETVDFREGQLSIIANAISRSHTIGLLPTGSGKSICYQLSAILQPAVSFVVSPIKSLMFDQKADLDKIYFTRTNYITGEDDGEERSIKENEFSAGKYFFIFISPERFQSKSFRKYLAEVNSKQKVAYAVIDEAHCLSEWGHDFRTSYLCLSSTINKFCEDFRFLGLTATASLNVLKDIQIEFGVSDLNVKSPENYAREELDFNVIIDNGNKENVLIEEISKLNDKKNVLIKKDEHSLCGIIFTPFVNGRNGCHSLSKSLSRELNIPVEFYSGSVPEDNGIPIMNEPEFLEYKNTVQDKFKKNDFNLLCATKAFGMGVNKKNIYYTFHYGIPGSMEALYQEAGRAGRDKLLFINDHAQCYVLLTESPETMNSDELWNSNTPFYKYLDQIIDETGSIVETRVSIDYHEHRLLTNQGFRINRGLFYYLTGDIRNQFYLFVQGDQTIEEQQNNILDVLESFYKTGESIEVNGRTINCSKEQTEKALYRLLQLGIVRDWTIKNYFGGGEFEVEFIPYNEQSIRENLFAIISKYDAEFSISSLENSEKYNSYVHILKEEKKPPIERYVRVLLEWSYYNFAGNRKQSLKDVYQNCSDLGKGNIKQDEFKRRIEAYFQFNENSFIFQHIADNPKEYKKWFEVFYSLDEKRKRTKNKISKTELETLQSNLSRFLESYIDNTGLNMISGLVRFLLSDFEDPDGRVRFERSLKQTFDLYADNKTHILEEIIDLVKDSKMAIKNELSASLCKFYTSDLYLKKINLALQDEKSRNYLLARSILKLRNINDSLLEKNG